MGVLGLVFVLGMITGFVAAAIVTKIKAVGYIKMTAADPEDGPYLFLEISHKKMPVIEDISKLKHVILKVDIPRK